MYGFRCFSLPFLGFFSPFLHSTGSLSVSREYLALPDGAGGFTQDFTGPALLRILTRLIFELVRDFHPLWLLFPKHSNWNIKRYISPTTPHNWRCEVWAIPRSLATTCGITIVFSSSGYLDVSVPQVTVFRHVDFIYIGFPIRTSTDQRLFASPRSFSQLITSFVVSESLGIRHTL